LRNAAAVLRALDIQLIAQYPQERHLRLDGYLARPAIDGEADQFRLPFVVLL
jgi:hypothetical protein